jgi:hypothetical protein
MDMAAPLAGVEEILDLTSKNGRHAQRSGDGRPLPADDHASDGVCAEAELGRELRQGAPARPHLGRETGFGHLGDV